MMTAVVDSAEPSIAAVAIFQLMLQQQSPHPSLDTP